MEKGARNRRNALGNTNEVYATELSSSQQVELNIGILNSGMVNLLGIVKNMSVQLDEISSTMKVVLNNGKNADANGKSTPAEPVMSVDPERDIVGEFHNLKQTSTVAEYQEKFEELRDIIAKMNYGLSEDYFISSFLSGLKQEIRRLIGNCKPETLYHAFNLARIQEMAIEMMKEKLISSDAEEQFLPCESADVFVDGDSPSDAEQQYLPCESVDVFVDGDNPLKFGAYVGEKAISVIISTGIPHSFIDASVAIHAGCEVEEAEPLLVKFVMGGYQAVSRFRCPRFQWTMQGLVFAAALRTVELKACDMVLGMDWVQHHYPMTFSLGGIFIQKDGKKRHIAFLNRRGSVSER